MLDRPGVCGHARVISYFLEALKEGAAECCVCIYSHSSAKNIALKFRCIFTTKNFSADKIKNTIFSPDNNELVFRFAHDRIDLMKIPVIIAENDYAMMCLYHGRLAREKIF